MCLARLPDDAALAVRNRANRARGKPAGHRDGFVGVLHAGLLSRVEARRVQAVGDADVGTAQVQRLEDVAVDPSPGRAVDAARGRSDITPLALPPHAVLPLRHPLVLPASVPE